MKLFRCTISQGVLLVSLLILSRPVRGEIALHFTSNVSVFESFSDTIGWAFTLSSPVLVTELGYYDSGDNGLVTAHEVAIWTNGGVLQLQATVPSGTSGTLMDTFRYISITPVFLPAGNYVIGGFSPGNSDLYGASVSSLTTAPQIVYGGPRFRVGPTLTFPDVIDFSHDTGEFGPNFQFAVPEPSSLVLLTLGAILGAIFFIRNPKRKPIRSVWE